MRPREVYERPHCACCGQLVTWKTVDKEILGRKLEFLRRQMCLGV